MMNKKVFNVILLAVIIGLTFDIFNPFPASARRVKSSSRYPQDYEGRMALYRSWGIKEPEKHDFLKTFLPEIVESRLNKLKILLNRADAGYYTELLEYASEDLENRAGTLDSIEGLRVSYRSRAGIDKVEPLILEVKPNTVRDNLSLLISNNIDQVKYSDLLFKISTFKLRNNIDFLKAVGVDFTKRPSLLNEPTRYLKNNYFSLTLLNREVTLKNLGLKTEDLVKELVAEIKQELSSPQLFKPKLPKRWEALLQSTIGMLSAQESFYNWLSEHPDEHIFKRMVKACETFDEFNPFGSIAPDYSIFILTTAIDIPSESIDLTSNFNNALLEFIKYLVDSDEKYDVVQLANKYAENFKLNEAEKFYLSSIIDREKKGIR